MTSSYQMKRTKAHAFSMVDEINIMREEYNLEENVFGSDNYLCHYTSFASLCSILSTMTLKVSSFANSNDIGELESNISCILDNNKVKEVESYVENHCGYISFSMNKEADTPYTNPKYGYLIPSLWGIYADKSQGVCIVIDEKSLIEENKDALSHANWNKLIDVSYTRFQSSKLASSKDSPEEIVHSYSQHILGTKHSSWSHEQERRFIGADLPQTLSLKNGVIRGVVIGKRVSSQQKKQLLLTLNNPHLACYNQLENSLFVRQEILGGNIFTTELGTYFS